MKKEVQITMERPPDRSSKLMAKSRSLRNTDTEWTVVLSSIVLTPHNARYAAGWVNGFAGT
eukprot:3771849-Pyramimonas_sp.AAC.1